MNESKAPGATKDASHDGLPEEMGDGLTNPGLVTTSPEQEAAIQNARIAILTRQLSEAQAQLAELKASLVIKFLYGYRRLVERHAPAFSRRRRLYMSLLRVVRRLLLRQRSNLKAPPVIVFQMGKVGSVSVVASLQREYGRIGIPVEVLHCHLLNRHDEHARVVWLRPNPTVTLEQIEKDRMLRARIDADRSTRWKVITPVREPVSRMVAWFFETAPEYIPDWSERLAQDSLKAEELQDVFLHSPMVLHAGPEKWFDEQMRPVFGVDVFAEPFPTQLGYKVYDGSPRASLLVIRTEDLTIRGPRAIQEFLGLPSFVLSAANEGSQKVHAALYRAFKKLPLPMAYLERLYSTRFARHFYTEQEISRFIARWRTPETG